jgi:hypothetical protein
VRLDRAVFVVRGADDQLEAQPEPRADGTAGEMRIRLDQRLVEEDRGIPGPGGAHIAQLVAQRLLARRAERGHHIDARRPAREGGQASIIDALLSYPRRQPVDVNRRDGWMLRSSYPGPPA